jgi:hydrogenase/urease accessory protein HupE
VTSASAAPPAGATAGKAFFRMGIEHILTGYDHLLFLVGLLLVLHPVRSLFGAITAFTVAHSLTLSLATLGVVGPAPAIVEPAIALSIAYVGIENWFVPNAKGRWRITLVFGLIHGFGFAGALREIALPRSELPAALLTFNLGVEIGQLGVVALVLPALVYANKHGFMHRRQLQLSSIPVAAMGLVWFVARVAA